MNEETYAVVILSDLHLKSEISRAREALELLHSIRFHRLIPPGDIFRDLKFQRLNREHWHFLSLIRKLSNPKRNGDIVWVEGNHDYGLVDVLSHRVGIPAHREYSWESERIRHLAIHGHQFDHFIPSAWAPCKTRWCWYSNPQRRSNWCASLIPPSIVHSKQSARPSKLRAKLP